jgi:outer membrane protein assembly factor BamB
MTNPKKLSDSSEMKMNRTVLLIAASLFAALLPLVTLASDACWPQFLGPGSRSLSANAKLPQRWSAAENVAWKTQIPGRGWSSPIAWNDRVFLTTVLGEGDADLPKKGLYFGGERPDAASSEYQWKVLCLDLLTGKVLWQRLVHRGTPPGPVHTKNSYASETPVTDGKRVYAYFGNVGVFCLDFEGRPVWSKPLSPHAMRHGWGTAASPVLHRDRLYLVDDNDEQSYILALDKESGKEVWRRDRDEKSNWSTPYVWENALRTEIVTPGTDKVRSYGLDGKLLWWFKGMSSITIATPYADGGLLYVSSGFVVDKRRPLYAIRPGGSGDISLASKQASNSAIAWSNPTAAPYNPTTLVYEGRLFVLYDRGLLSAFDSRTGKPLYEQQRLPEGKHFTSSPWANDGRVYCLNEDGVTFVVSAADTFKLLHTNKLAEDDMCMATPAMIGDRLLIRTSARIYCIRTGPSSP